MSNLRDELTVLCLRRLEDVIGREIQLHGAGARQVRGGWDLWIDYEWDDHPGARADSPFARRSPRHGRAQATVRPWRGEGDQRQRRSLLIALAHIVAEMAGSTGLGFRLLS